MAEQDLKAAAEALSETSTFSLFDRVFNNADGKVLLDYLLNTYVNSPIIHGVPEPVLSKNAEGKSSPEQIDLYYRACSMVQSHKEFQFNPARISFMLGQQDVVRNIFSTLSAYDRAKSALAATITGAVQ